MPRLPNKHTARLRKGGRVAVVCREVVDGKERKMNAQLFCAHIRWRSRCAKGMCSADPECTHHSSIPKSEAPVLIDLTTKSAKKLVVVPPATVGLGLCSAAIHDVSYDSLFTALELIALKPWLVIPAKESDCTVTVCGSHEACFDQERWY